MNPIILALDCHDIKEASNILNKARPYIGMIKIGLELFTAEGWESLKLASDFNIPVFLDLKLHDVPTTVAKTTRVLCDCLSKFDGNHFLSVHCFGGRGMLEAALKETKQSNVTLVGITALTSLSEDDFRDFGFKDRRAGVKSLDLATLGCNAGLSHFVCGPAHLQLMKKYFGGYTFITPGIRTETDESDDHAKSKPARFAIKNGANWIVIGRPITKAADIRAAAIYFKNQVELV
jgi:orotidine-5'-phosphate decarboxylase